MQNPDFIIILINFLIIAFSYLWLYEKIADNNIQLLAKYDFISSVVALGIAAIFFWDSQIIFTILGIETNWFWFSLVTFFTIEIPFSLWYFKKHDLWKSL